jgi:hypothetical protein
MRGFGIIVTFVILAIVGIGSYQLGLAQGAGGTAVAPAPYYYPFFFGGFLFPLLFTLLVVFAIGGAARAWGRGGHSGGWAYQSRRERLEELHREMHGEKPKDQSASSASPPSGR